MKGSVWSFFLIFGLAINLVAGGHYHEDDIAEEDGRGRYHGDGFEGEDRQGGSRGDFGREGRQGGSRGDYGREGGQGGSRGDYGREGGQGGRDRSRQGGSGGVSCDGKEGRDRFLRAFLKLHCPDAEGNYDLCRNCVSVACLQFITRPTQGRLYQDCIEDHNRCCTKPGASATNIGAGLKCYATGWLSEAGWGQASVLRTVLGGQSEDAPRSIQGDMKDKQRTG